MAPNLPNSAHERRSEPVVRLCVPAGFFERLAAAVDFRSITKSAFSRYNPRPSTSKVDPTVYFKVLLLEYIFDVSSDALHNELTLHPGLRTFLNVDDKNPMPLPNEIILFRVKLGWMGFKQMLDTVLREAKQNKLSEIDCSILEKRFNNPLVVAVDDQLAAPTSSRCPAPPSALEAEPRRGVLFSEDSGSGFPHYAAANSPPAESHSQTEQPLDPRTGAAGRTQPTYVQSTLQETAQMIWANRSDVREANRRKALTNFESPWPLEVPSHAAPALHQTQSTASQAENKGGSYRELNRPTTQAMGHAATPRQTGKFESSRVGASVPASEPGFRSPQSRPSLSSDPHTFRRRTQNQGESEIDPLGIESFFDVNHAPPASNETRVEAPRPASARIEPSASVSLNQNFTIVSSPVSERNHHSKPPQRQEHTRIEEPGIWNMIDERQSYPSNRAVTSQERFADERSRHEYLEPAEDRPSDEPSDYLQEASPLEEIPEFVVQTPRARMQKPTLQKPKRQVIPSDERSRQVKPVGKAPRLKSQPPQAWTNTEGSEEYPPHKENLAPAFAGYAHALAKRQFLVVEFFTKSLYIAIPLLVVFGVYVLIVVLKNNQSRPFTSPPAVTRTATKESPRNSVDVPAPLPPVPAVSVPEKQLASSKSSEKAATATEGTSSSLVKRPVKTAQATAVEPKAPASSRAMDQSLEALKKEAIVLHLRQTFHLDLQPDQYTYQELKEINDRLEKEIKKQ